LRAGAPLLRRIPGLRAWAEVLPFDSVKHCLIEDCRWDLGLISSNANRVGEWHIERLDAVLADWEASSRSNSRIREFLEARVIEAYVGEYWKSGAHKTDVRRAVFRMLGFELWLEEFVTKKAPTPCWQ
jgi:hypothetical protein